MLLYSYLSTKNSFFVWLNRFIRVFKNTQLFFEWNSSCSNYIMKSVLFVFVILLLLSTKNLHGQTTRVNACYVASEGRGYALVGPTCFIGTIICDRTFSPNYISLTRVTTTACTTCSGSKLGVIVDYTVYPCPIDDYIPFLILPIGIIGLIYLRQKHPNLSL